MDKINLAALIGLVSGLAIVITLFYITYPDYFWIPLVLALPIGFLCPEIAYRLLGGRK